jgi:hypothetical protein
MTSLSLLFLIVVVVSETRVRREFMYIAEQLLNNSTVADCYQLCNDEWNVGFMDTFNTSSRDFYDFPMHPLILDDAGYSAYCALSTARLACYMNECSDASADRVFSPSNFICIFKADLLNSARVCLADTEPLTFLKCDEHCHDRALKAVGSGGVTRAAPGQVFSMIDAYESELDLLCHFQSCFRDCQQPIIAERCDELSAKHAFEFIASYVSWHSADVFDWHTASDNVDRFPDSCRQLLNADNDHDNVQKENSILV